MYIGDEVDEAHREQANAHPWSYKQRWALAKTVFWNMIDEDSAYQGGLDILCGCIVPCVMALLVMLGAAEGLVDWMETGFRQGLLVARYIYDSSSTTPLLLEGMNVVKDHDYPVVTGHVAPLASLATAVFSEFVAYSCARSGMCPSIFACVNMNETSPLYRPCEYAVDSYWEHVNCLCLDDAFIDHIEQGSEFQIWPPLRVMRGPEAHKYAQLIQEPQTLWTDD